MKTCKLCNEPVRQAVICQRCLKALPLMSYEATWLYRILLKQDLKFFTLEQPDPLYDELADKGLLQWHGGNSYEVVRYERIPKATS